jgi:hypothetical protein
MLAATMVASGLSFAPAYAEETEVTEPVATQEMVQMEEGSEAGEGVDTGAGETQEMVNLEESQKIVIGLTREGEFITREANAPGSAITIESMNSVNDEIPEWYFHEINTVDDLVLELGASNVSRISDTEIKLQKDIQFPEDSALSLFLSISEVTIDFNGHVCKGLICFAIEDGNVTVIDSTGSNSGGIRSSMLEAAESYYYVPSSLAVDGGSLSIQSGKYKSCCDSVFARTGNLSIQGGVFEASDKTDDVGHYPAVSVFAGMSTARIMGGKFIGDLCAVGCYKYRLGEYDGPVLPNPLKISGGSFSCTSNEPFTGAVVYEDLEQGEWPDLNEILALGHVFEPSKTYQGPDGYDSYTEKNVSVKSSDEVSDFVYRLYSKVLDREPDAAGFTNWVTKLTSKTNSGSDAAYGFFFSPELTKRDLSNEEFVTLLYNVFLNRAPDNSGMNTWLSALETGASRMYVFSGFANSQEWKGLCAEYGIEPGSYMSDEPRDQNLKVTAFVQRLYTLCLNRSADVKGLNNWTAALNNKTQDGAHVAYGFFFSQEFIGRNLSNADYVEVLYKVLLGRDSDPVGKADWVKKLEEGTEKIDVFRGFVHSQEFDKICADYGIVRGTI